MRSGPYFLERETELGFSERMILYEKRTCMEGPRLLILQIFLWRNPMNEQNLRGEAPREQLRPVTVEVLTDPDNSRLPELENSYLAEIGEAPLSANGLERLKEAVRAGKIVIFLAKSGNHTVGMCSVSTSFSTFSCGEVGTFDDFFVEPAFRKQGVARLLARAAQDWCAQRGIASLTVCCAPCDEEMYRALGFHLPLGRCFAHLNQK